MSVSNSDFSCSVFGCVKIMLMHAFGCIDMEFMKDVNYM